MTKTAGLLVGVPALGALIAGVLSCGVAAQFGAAAKTDSQHHLVIVLLDETSSFQKFWDESVSLTATVANRLRPGDAFTVIGIDDHGKDNEDTRVPIRILNPGALNAIGERNQLVHTVRELRQRKMNPDREHDLTDITGALSQAAGFTNNLAVQDYYPIVLLFTDLEQTQFGKEPLRLPKPEDVSGSKFKNGGEAHCFLVDLSGWTKRTQSLLEKDSRGTAWNNLVDVWTAVFRQAGLEASASSFHQAGDSRVEIERLFPKR